MNWDFDWLSNWRVTLNMLVNVALGALAGSALAYYTIPGDFGFWSKPVMAAGVVPAITAFVAKMQKTPSELHTENQTTQIQKGEISGRRLSDPPKHPTPNP